MPTLNFPTNPTLNQLYTFGGKTWIWTGQAWRLDPQGAINGIVIGNTAPAAGTFTTLTANTLTVNNETVYANLAVGNLAVSNVSVTGNVNSALNVLGNVTGTNVITGGTVSASGNIGTLAEISALGNITTSGYFVGDGSQLSNITAGSQINQGNSNVAIQGLGGNVSVGVHGVSNVAVFTPTGLQVSNVTATGNVTGNYFIGNGSQLTGIVASAGSFIENGASNVKIPSANANITVSVSNTANVAVFSATQLSVAGNVVAQNFVGNGQALTGVLADRGGDSNNWNTLTEMGVYTVNRASWSGTTGTPLDSQVFVGLLEVVNSTDTAITQVFYPGTTEPGDQKIQWNRSKWAGSWTGWIKIVNDFQIVQGGDF